MAKKRRRRQKQRPPRVPYSRPEGSTAPEVLKEPSPQAPPRPEMTPVSPVQASETRADELAYVRKDLIRIAILAVLIFGAQFALKFWMGL